MAALRHRVRGPRAVFVATARGNTKGFRSPYLN